MHKDKLDTTYTLSQSTPLSITELTSAIKSRLESSFGSVSVQGEISNCKLHSSGHLYFDMKDQGAKIPAVLFHAARHGFSRPPREGDQVVAKGSVSVYPPHGRYQLIVKQLTMAGIGALLLKFEELKKKLHALGWFDREHKKLLPPFPKTIGVVTSKTGAVIQDIIHVLRRRSPGFHLRLCPVLVQGEGAAEQIAEAIELFNRHQLADVLIVGRGGGSLEDLWPFNEEIVASAIYNSQIPIISAVGHETDVTLSDYVADVRAPTPSAAAEIVSSKSEELLASLIQSRLQLDRMVRRLIDTRRDHLLAMKRNPYLASPLSILQLPLQKLDRYGERLDYLAQREFERRGQQLKRVVGELRALDPRNVLQRGFSILFDENEGSVITSAKKISPHTPVRAQLADGDIHMTVNG